MGSSRERSVKDPDGMLATVAQCIEHLRKNSSTLQEKEFLLIQLSDLVARENALTAVGSHYQAVPVLVSLLRAGSFQIKIQAANVLGSLCKENDLRVKVLLGGCIPPLLSLLKSASQEAQLAAATTIHAVSHGGPKDHIGSKIFSTEGVVPVLWKLLESGPKSGNLVDNLLTGALRNLSSYSDGFCLTTVVSREVDVLVNLLKKGEPGTKANACYLLSHMMTVDTVVCDRILEAGITKNLVSLVGPGHDPSVRAEAAAALKSFSLNCKGAKYEITSCGGIPALINATIAPSKEFMKGEYAHALQENAMSALANISGGLSHVISSLGQSLEGPHMSPVQRADTLGALASALMIYDTGVDDFKSSDPSSIERVLVSIFDPHPESVVRERAVEALASLYGNAILSGRLENPEAKRLLVGLITTTAAAAGEVHDELMKSLLLLCREGGCLWRAVRGREGVQLLISLLGLATEQQQEGVVSLLCILSEVNDESKWAVTAAGGIPPLVQILESGPTKAREDAAAILGNLCDHSEDIRACVESADCVPALLWLLKNGTTSGKKIAARTLNQLIRRPDTSVIGQLTGLLTDDLPESKVYVLEILKNMLFIAPVRDLLEEGGAANDAIETVVKCLASSKGETQAVSASALSVIFQGRRDLRESTVGVKTFWYIMKIFNSCENETVLVEFLRCLASIFLSVGTDRDVAAFSKEALPSLLNLVNSPALEVTEQAVCAISNLLLDIEVAEMVVPEEILFSATRVMLEGSGRGKALAATMFYRLLRSRYIDQELADCVNRSGAVPALVSYLEHVEEDGAAISEALDVLYLLVWCGDHGEDGGGRAKPTWSVHFPARITPLVSCIPMVGPSLQDKVIEILSWLCWDQSAIIGEAVRGSPMVGSSVARRVIDSVKTEVKIGGCMILISGGKVDPYVVIGQLSESDSGGSLVHALVSMLDQTRSFLVDEKRANVNICRLTNEEVVNENMERTTVIYGNDAATWLLSLIACYDKRTIVLIMEAGAIEVINERIYQCLYKCIQADFMEDNNNLWIFLLLLAILFQDTGISSAQETVKSIQLLANILKSDDIASRYFAAQAISSLVCNGNRGTLLSVANSGVATGLISLLGCAEYDIHDLLRLADDFTLLRFPEIEALEGLFRVDEIRDGSASHKAIPALVDLLKPIPDRPGAPLLALGLLAQLADNSPSNTAVMVESGVLEALTRYLSLGPQDAPEEAATDLLGTLFGSAEIRCHESAPGAVTQLVAVLRLGGRSARYSAARALERLFSSIHIRSAENSLQAVHPLVETLVAGSEKEQQAAIAALVKLLTHNNIYSRAHIDADAEIATADALFRILSSDCSVDVKGDAAELCGVLFASTRVRSTMVAARCVEPLLSLLLTDLTPPPAQLSVVRALDRLLDDDQLAELVAAHGSVIPLVGLLYGKDDDLHEAVCHALVKLGKDRPLCKTEMVKAGVVESTLEILTDAPVYLCTALAELLRILTNNATIARGPSAAKVVEPLFLLLQKVELGPDGRHSTLQVLVNILEHHPYNPGYVLMAKQAIGPLIPLLDLPIPAVQQLAAELLSHLLQDESLQKDAMIPQVIGPLMRVVGSGVDFLQQGAVRALVCVAGAWPNEIAKEGGVNQLSNVILQTDPSPPLWESAASVLASILQYSSDYFLEVPVAVLVRLLRSTSEQTVVGSLNALLVLESDDGTSGEAMAESDAIDALLELLKCHQCEESAARLLEVLLNNVKIRESKAAKAAILPLSQYLLDPQTVSVQARLLASLALGDLFQNEGFSRTGDAQSACRALVNVLEDQPTEELKVVAICALQNLVMYSRSNKRAVAEARGVQVLLDLIGSSDPDTSVQAAIFIKLLFSNHTIQEYASSETVRALTAAIEKELWATGSVNEEYIKALNALFNNFTRLRATEPATLSIPHLVSSLKTPVEATQEAALDTLFLLRQAWSACPAEVSRAQSVAAADAIPLLQFLIQSGPPRFQEKAEFLLQCLPGTLVVIIKRGSNMKQSVGTPSLYCKLMLANTPPKQTKILSTGPNPEWDESFSWSFESPPKGQKLQIACKNKSKMGKSSFGKVTIQIDRVVMLGSVSGEYALIPESKSGPSRNLEIEFQWSNT